MESALSDIKVLCLAGQLPGPYCTMLLADMGAEVIMLERPGVGDAGRLFPGVWEAMNRNKKSIALNLQSPEGLKVCHRLIQASDVVVEGFRPGVAARLKVDYETCRTLRPDIIYASISGYGQDGPYRDLPGHETNYQAMAGMLVNDGHTADLPYIRLSDLSSGMFTAIGILTALHHRDSTGNGQFIDVSMAAGLVSWRSIELYQHLNGQKVRRVVEPGHGIFQTRDHQHLSLGVIHEDNFWAKLCQVIGRPELSGLLRPQRLERKEALHKMLADVFLTRSRDDWFAVLKEAGIPVAPAYSVEEVAGDPHFNYRKMFPEVATDKGTERQVANPLKFSTCSTEVRTPPPDVGQHTSEILNSLGYSKAEIEGLKKAKAI